jgi:hypothetical protein
VRRSGLGPGDALAGGIPKIAVTQLQDDSPAHLIIGACPWPDLSARPVGAVAPVVCAGRPPIRRSRPTASYDVRAEVAGRSVELAVWEVFPFARPAADTGLPVGRAA